MINNDILNMYKFCFYVFIKIELEMKIKYNLK